MNDTIDVEPIIQKIQVTPQFKDIYDKALLAGMRAMFDKNSHQMLLDQMEKEGPMADKIAEGVVALLYMMFKESNDTLPPQIMAPLTVTFVLRAFEFLQKSEDPEATPEVLGDAIDKALTSIASKFGVPSGDIAAYSKQMQGQVDKASGGLLQGGA